MRGPGLRAEWSAPVRRARRWGEAGRSVRPPTRRQGGSGSPPRRVLRWPRDRSTPPPRRMLTWPRDRSTPPPRRMLARRQGGSGPPRRVLTRLRDGSGSSVRPGPAGRDAAGWRSRPALDQLRPGWPGWSARLAPAARQRGETWRPAAGGGVRRPPPPDPRRSTAPRGAVVAQTGCSPVVARPALIGEPAARPGRGACGLRKQPGRGPPRSPPPRPRPDRRRLQLPGRRPGPPPPPRPPQPARPWPRTGRRARKPRARPRARPRVGPGQPRRGPAARRPLSERPGRQDGRAQLLAARPAR